MRLRKTVSSPLSVARSRLLLVMPCSNRERGVGACPPWPPLGRQITYCENRLLSKLPGLPPSTTSDASQRSPM
jgi:hypothetical protein